MKKGIDRNTINDCCEQKRGFPIFGTRFSVRWTLAAVAAAALVSCAANRGAETRHTLSKTPKIEVLFQKISTVDPEEVSLLVPGEYDRAVSYLEASSTHAQRGEFAEAEKAANAGLDSMQQVEKRLRDAQEVFGDVMSARRRARDASARALFTARFEGADMALRERTAAFENGERQNNKKYLSRVRMTYEALEQEARKLDKVTIAKRVFAYAEKTGAADFAPRTMQRAERELDLVRNAETSAGIDHGADISKHADMAVWWAKRGEAIAELVKRFEQLDMSREDTILWYQAQLLSIRSPLEETLPFHRSNAAVVEVLKDDIRGLLSSIEDMRQTQSKTQQQVTRLEEKIEEEREEHVRALNEAIEKAKSSEQERIAALKRQLEKTSGEAAEKARQLALEEQRFEDIRKLFTSEQGEVVRKGKNVILRLHGFDFQPGKSVIQAKNYGLLSKVEAAIEMFPKPFIEITGHTDNRGSDEGNTELSVRRALEVEKFLHETCDIPTSRIKSEGRGDSEPVAANDTEEGRAKNRRIEIAILNVANVPYNPAVHRGPSQ